MTQEIKDKTESLQEKSIEETLSKLAEYLGTTDTTIIKMFSILSKDQIRKKAMMLGDIQNYSACRLLKAYAYQDLFLNCSLDGKRAEQIVDIAKTPFQIGENQEKNRVKRAIGDLFR